MNVANFLIKHHLAPDYINTDEMIELCLEEIKKGLLKFYEIDKCSIPLLPTYINRQIEVNDKEYIVIDAGGTNFRSAIAKLEDGQIKLTNFNMAKMPGVRTELTKQEFYNEFLNNIKPIINNYLGIGLCFSYQLKMQKDLSGTLVAWAKEIKAEEVVGTDIGKELLKVIYNENKTHHDIAIINDTVAVLLGSLTLNQGFDSYIGCIYGTGFNVCYEEQTSNILKIDDYKENSMIINTEVGNFSKFIKGDIDIELNNHTNIKNEALAEKMISGFYLPKIISIAFKKAVEENVITKNTNFDTFNMVDVSTFLEDETGRIADSFIEHDLVKTIIDSILSRAAKLASIIISSFAIKSGAKNIGIALEGTTIYKTPTLLDKLKYYLDSILLEKGIKYSIIDGRDKILQGALMAIMKKMTYSKE